MDPRNFPHGYLIPNYPTQQFLQPHVNPNFLRQWNQQFQRPMLPPAFRPNIVHVNPAFFNPSSDPNLPNPKKIIVNPKFFPQVQQPEAAKVIPTTATTEKPISKPSPIQAPKSVDSPRFPKLPQRPTSLPKNKYKWKKSESPLKPPTPSKQTRYKLIRKATTVKSPKLSMLLLNKQLFVKPGLWLSPPKLASTPIKSPGIIKTTKSRFKLDNRKKKTVKPSLSSPAVVKQPVANNKIWRSKAVVKWYRNQQPPSSIIVNRSFTNFKSPLTRSHLNPVLPPRGSRKLQRLFAAIKPIKSTTVHNKKNKSIDKPNKTKIRKTRKRYYDEEETRSSQPSCKDETLGEEIEIAVKPSGAKERTPLGALPSFITL